VAPDPLTNLLYLKNAVLAWMCSASAEERRRMLPAIALLLQLSKEEVARVSARLGGEGGGLLTGAWSLWG
jgi:hypothetical protein